MTLPAIPIGKTLNWHARWSDADFRCFASGIATFSITVFSPLICASGLAFGKVIPGARSSFQITPQMGRGNRVTLCCFAGIAQLRGLRSSGHAEQPHSISLAAAAKRSLPILAPEQDIACAPPQVGTNMVKASGSPSGHQGPLESAAIGSRTNPPDLGLQQWQHRVVLNSHCAVTVKLDSYCPTCAPQCGCPDFWAIAASMVIPGSPVIPITQRRPHICGQAGHIH